MHFFFFTYKKKTDASLFVFIIIPKFHLEFLPFGSNFNEFFQVKIGTELNI